MGARVYCVVLTSWSWPEVAECYSGTLLRIEWRGFALSRGRFLHSTPGTVKPWSDLGERIQAAAQRQGRAVDTKRMLRRLDGAVMAYYRRRSEPSPLRAESRRKRLRRFVRATRALEAELGALESEEAQGRLRRDDSILLALRKAWPRISGVAIPLSEHLAAVYPREHPFEFDEWRESLRRMRHHAERLLLNAERPAKPGVRADPALASLLREVAWILGVEGLRPSTHPTGLLAQCARAVAHQVGVRLPADENLKEKLMPAIRFVRRNLGG